MSRCNVRVWNATEGEWFEWDEKIPEDGWAWACATHGPDDEAASDYGQPSRDAAEKQAEHHVIEVATQELIDAGELP